MALHVTMVFMMYHRDYLHDNIVKAISDTCIPQVLNEPLLEIHVGFSVAKLLHVIINMVVSNIQLPMWSANNT